MYTFWLVLHVIAAVVLMGPFLVAPLTGLRALRERDAATLRQASRTTTQYSLASLATFALGLLVVATSPDDGFKTPWVVISITLFVVALALALFVSAPALGKASGMVTTDVEQERKEKAEAESPTARQQDPQEMRKITDARVLAHSAARERLQDQRGRIVAASGTTAVLMVIVIILMVTQPFG